MTDKAHQSQLMMMKKKTIGKYSKMMKIMKTKKNSMKRKKKKPNKDSGVQKDTRDIQEGSVH